MQLGSGHPVEARGEAQGMEAPLAGGGVHIAEVWPNGSGFVHLRGVDPMCPLVHSYTFSSVGAGHHGTDVIEALSVHLSSDCSAPGSSSECLTRPIPLLVAPFWPAQVLFSDLVSHLDNTLWELPFRRELLSQVCRGRLFTPSQRFENFGSGP